MVVLERGSTACSPRGGGRAPACGRGARSV